MISRIALIGAGRVASQLGMALLSAGVTIEQVYSRTADKARLLAGQLRSEAVEELAAIRPGADLYVLAVSDGAISPVSAALSKHLPASCRVAHVSGATALPALGSHFTHAGVLYPLQTFSAERMVDWSEVPFCIEANHSGLLHDLRMLAQKISTHVYQIDATQRATLHVAAVFANNFSNYLFDIAQEIAQAKNLPFDLLRPLILETARKVQEKLPGEAQTGPAVRNDQETIERHLLYLQQHHPQYVPLYQMLTEGIEKPRIM